MNRIKIKLFRESSKAPVYSSEFAAGADVFADIPEPVTVQPHETVLIPAGFALEIPEGYVGLIYARSGMATKRHLAPANKVGVIDSDYRGEVMVSLHNHSSSPARLEPAERIAQLVIAPVLTPGFEVCDELSQTVRGNGGFGSTGTK